MRFYLDEDLSQKIAEIARARGLDVISSHECGRDRLSDEEQLRHAAAEGRCFVTRNRDDFEALTVQFFERGWPHAGVLILTPSHPGDRFAAIADALVRFSEAHAAGLPAYAVCFPPR